MPQQQKVGRGRYRCRACGGHFAKLASQSRQLCGTCYHRGYDRRVRYNEPTPEQAAALQDARDKLVMAVMKDDLDTQTLCHHKIVAILDKLRR